MLGRKAKLRKSAFNTGILTTFGKVDQQDIDKIDGNSERLVTQLIQQYGWIPEDAQNRVDFLSARLSKESKYCKMPPKQRVGS